MGSTLSVGVAVVLLVVGGSVAGVALDPSTPTPAPGPDGSAPGFGLFAAVLALLGLAALIRRR